MSTKQQWLHSAFSAKMYVRQVVLNSVCDTFHLTLVYALLCSLPYPILLGNDVFLLQKGILDYIVFKDVDRGLFITYLDSLEDYLYLDIV